ncbi:MAG: hypothetical protein RIQ71_2102 [Verrucomicrobiota bacterium]|jgi:hypothetical protein
MKTTRESILTVLVLAFVVTADCARAEILINQPFDGSSAPSELIMSDRENAKDADAKEEAAKAAGDWFSNGATGFFPGLRENSPQQRATVIYGAGMFRADQDFVIRMDLRMPEEKNIAEGVILFWLDAASFADIAKTIGDAGELEGKTRVDMVDTAEGEDNSWSSRQRACLKGYALDFAYNPKDAAEHRGYAALVDLRDWMSVDWSLADLSADSKFHDGNGWQTVQFGFDSASDIYTLSRGYDGSSFAETVKYSAARTEKLSASYFGIQAGNDDAELKNSVRNISFRGTAAGMGAAAVPEPGTWAAAALLAAGAVIMRWRKRAKVS